MPHRRRPGLELVLATIAVLAGAFSLHIVLVILRDRRREDAVRLPDGAEPLRLARDLPARLFVDKDIAGGPVSRGINRGPAHIVLTEDRFFVATWQGRVLEIAPGAPGSARCVGPRRLVVEAEHPSRRAHVRAELLVEEAEEWARAIGRLAAPSR